MVPDEHTDECPEDLLSEVMATAQASDEDGLAATDQALRTHAGDARLHFLRGSLLAGLKRYDEARQAMGRAVQIAPTFAVARFQLGLLELTSGQAEAAEATWGPLQDLPEHHYLRLFAAGLGRLIRDDFPGTIALLMEGIENNDENLPLNRDMQMMIAEAQKKLDEAAGEEPSSAAQLLLQRFGKDTRH